MKKVTLIAAVLLLAGTALADSYRVSYTLRGLNKRITVSAESSAEARRTVQDISPARRFTELTRSAGRYFAHRSFSPSAGDPLSPSRCDQHWASSTYENEPKVVAV